MFRVRRRAAARLSAAMLVTSLAVAGSVATAGSAAAEDGQNPSSGATAKLNGLKIADDAKLEGKPVKAGLFEMAVDNGGTLQSYCIDAHTPTVKDARYQEVAWDQSSLHNNADAGKIHWILKNSYPQVNDLGALAKAAGAGSLTEKQAAAGTQVAIWRFSDHLKAEAVNEDAEKLADYLESKAQDIAEPATSLSLSTAAVSGKAGEKLGPITVSTNAGSATVATAAEGVKVVDGSGNPVTSAVNGTELFFDVPEDAPAGTASLTVKATTKLSVGRAFTGIGVKTQTQILAGSSDSTVEATATATWGEKEHTGPVLAAESVKNCAKGGVDVKVTNSGDQPGEFTVGGEKHTVEAGKDVTVTVPVKEDAEYTIEVTGPNGFTETFTGILDCETAGEETTGGSTGATTGGESPEPSSAPSPASAGGSDATTGGDLAETGGSSATPVIAGIAVALVVVGGATVFLIRKRKSA
ncbi:MULTISPECIES: Cys-Gln thioester bond-forming surface protein [Streptomyces]|uniref:Cys-Gln thioester bond-forming surface protein n=1 Tax=Streptomyces TaxID=1883 RepID=UPI0022AAE62B|nr:Cys-Gln thioester bond-forming surface protein [Streptomyces sp. HB2AG]MCZ2523267.1 Cys-Gln thioester bond-forming surface protein [Streptomyces sp. HB2AG]